jgi:hypothetical protein
MGGSKNGGTTKWMVYDGKSQNKMGETSILIIAISISAVFH